jgi:uncharacterized protein (DUF433 family)
VTIGYDDDGTGGRTMLPIEIHDRGRGPELKGTRITVYDIIPYRLGGLTPAEISETLAHPEVTPAHVEALFRYMDEHRDEVMAVHREIEERIARGNPPWVEERMRESSARFKARLAEVRANLAGRNGDGHPG